MNINRAFWTKYLGNIIIGLFLVSLEISLISFSLMFLNMLPHNIVFLQSFGFIQWFVLVSIYRVFTYRYIPQRQEYPIDNIIGGEFDATTQPTDPGVQPLQNVIPSNIIEDINERPDHFSVRE
jgi:hypothetical protein